MGYKKQIMVAGIIAVSTATIMLGLAFYWETLCLENNIFKGCYQFGNNVMNPILLLSAGITVSLFLLYFLKEGVYKAWRKFAVIYLPIAIFLIAISPTHSSNFLGGPSVGYDREGTTIALSIIFLLISLILIIYKSIKLRKK